MFSRQKLITLYFHVGFDDFIDYLNKMSGWCSCCLLYFEGGDDSRLQSKTPFTIVGL